MKWFFMLALMFSVSALAQETVNDFRIVDGVLYNIKKSSKWEELSYGNSFDESCQVVVIKAVLPDGSLDCDRNFYTRYSGGGMFLESTERLVLKNYPKEIQIGNEIHSLRAMRLPAKAGDNVNFYDFGLMNTPENRKTLKIVPVPSIVVNTNAEIEAFQRASSIKIKVLKSNQDAAANGDA